MSSMGAAAGEKACQRYCNATIDLHDAWLQDLLTFEEMSPGEMLAGVRRLAQNKFF